MRVYSNVIDHYHPQFDRWIQPAPTVVPQVESAPFDWQKFFDVKGQVEQLETLIKEFKEALEHAKKLDILMQKPDCEDVEKAKLVKRVEDLEKELKKLKPKKKAK